nr:MAG: RNA-dependent RNA polymerase [Riboviria sp.]
MFEKFEYAEPCPSIKHFFPDEWSFADEICYKHHNYMQDSEITPIMCTTKNMESTPGFPKFLFFQSEQEYVEKCGAQEYIKIWNLDQFESRPLWWCFLKQETLKKKKVEDNDIRMILCTDPVFTRIGAAFEQDQNERMKSLTETHYAQVGWTPFFGGLHKRLKRLEKVGSQYVEMDWTRFDGTIPEEVFMHIKNMRYHFLADDYKSDRIRDLHDWYCYNLVHKLILLPTGEVTEVHKGNPSGQYSTTTDNNMVNVFLTAFEIAYLYKKQFGCVPDVDWWRENIDMLCYGDDRLLRIPAALHYDPLVVSDMYKRIFGMWVKIENVRVQDKIDGLSFCGFTIHCDLEYYGVPNTDKILSSLGDPVRRLPDVTSLWGKLVSLRLLCEKADDDVKHYLDKQIFRVADYCSAAGIEIPSLPANFFELLW